MSADNKRNGASSYLFGKAILVVFVAVLFVAVYVLVKAFLPGSPTDSDSVQLRSEPVDYSAAEELLKNSDSSITVISGVSFIATNAEESAINGGLISFYAMIYGTNASGAVRYELRNDVTITENADISLLTRNCCAILDNQAAARTVDIRVHFGEQSHTFSYNAVRQAADNTNLAILLNPYTGVAQDYAPESTREVGNRFIDSRAADDLAQMFEAAKAAGFSMSCNSCYRDYAKQQVLYNYAVRTLGQNQTDTAPPGFSEHQSGLAADITWSGMNGGLSADMQYMDEYFWLVEHSWEYGFVLRYENNQTAKTGYMFEPWHYRYIGRELAKLYHEGGYHTLDEFLSVPR